MKTDWQPTADIETLRQRAQIMQQIRDYFAAQQVLEVETPQLSRFGVTDVYLQNLSCLFSGPGFAKQTPLYLQTSPEYAMKRLLCAGSGSIFTLCKAYRDDEVGRQHNPEFTMLEWYRTGFDHHQLMDDMQALLQPILATQTFLRISYQQAFMQYLQVDPLSAELSRLREIAARHGLADITVNETDRDFILQLLFSQQIEPLIAEQLPVFVYDFPASQASLARLSQQDPRVAHRFELYYRGIELANGFFELQDATEQRQRFEQDNAKRQALGMETKALDEAFLAALEHGMPMCSGVALGIDRLVMLALNKASIREVIAFPLDIA